MSIRTHPLTAARAVTALALTALALTAFALPAPAAAQQPGADPADEPEVDEPVPVDEPGLTDEPAPGDEPEATPRYRVEVIVFEHRDVDPREERLPTAARAPQAGSPVPLRRAPFGIEAGTGEFGEPVFSDRPSERQDAAQTPGPDDSSDAPAPDAAQSSSRDPADRAEAPGDPGSAGPARDEDPDRRLEPFGPAGFGTRAPERWFEPLADEALTLGDERRRLERLDAYRVLAHTGWEQDALGEQQARPLDLTELGITNPSGTLTLVISRFAHVIVDLRYRTAAFENLEPASAPGDPADPGDPRNPGDPADPADRADPGNRADPLDPGALEARSRTRARSDAAGLSEIRTAPSYVLDTRRRARTGELHYIDHPLLGILFSVTEAPEEPDEESEPADDELSPAA